MKETLVTGDFPTALAIWNSTASTYAGPCRHLKEGMEPETRPSCDEGEELLKILRGIGRNGPAAYGRAIRAEEVNVILDAERVLSNLVSFNSRPEEVR